MNINNVIQMQNSVEVGGYVLNLRISQGRFEDMVNAVVASIPEAIELNQHVGFMRFYGDTFDAQRICTMLDNANDAYSTAFVVAGVLKANDCRPAHVRTALVSMFNTRGVNQTDVVAAMYVLNRYFKNQGVDLF